MKIAALYARVSGDQQRDSNTIASQTALIAYANNHGYRVAADMVIEDDGYTGAVLERPGLERVRDLAAEGRIDTVLVHSPDRLSRRYAYQVLIIEELARQGVEVVFLNAPSMETPEDHLLVQFQGMIAEYERAQILERSRRGKRHRACRGEVAVPAHPMATDHKKTPDSDAFYEIVEPQASVVRDVYRYYTGEHLSIGAITRKLNERAVPTSIGASRWERSTVWAMLRNPAYKGKACFGKTRQMPRKCVTRPVRLSGGVVSATTGGHEKPRAEWIEIPVPAVVSEETFALAEERLETNKTHSPRRTKTPSVVQGLVSCGRCGYALSRTSAQTSARKISYYRCLGSDSWRHLNGPLCDSRPVRQDLLDEIVWSEVVRLLEEPALIGAEIDRRLEAARASDPNQQREIDLRHRLVRIRNPSTIRKMAERRALCIIRWTVTLTGFLARLHGQSASAFAFSQVLVGTIPAKRWPRPVEIRQRNPEDEGYLFAFPPSWRTCSYDHGFLPAPRGQPPRQILRGPVRRRPLGLAAARHTELPGQDLPYDGDWQQRVDHGLFGPYPAWRQPCDAYPSSIAAGAREPVEQHGLAVAARPHQRHVVRRSVTAKQVRHALRQHPLLLLAPGWVRLRHGRLLAYCPPCSPSWKESVT